MRSCARCATSALRGRFAYGPAQGMPDDQPMDLDDLARMKREWMPATTACSRSASARAMSAA